MQQAQSAIEEMFSSPKLLAIQACSVHEQMFLNNWNLRRPLLQWASDSALSLRREEDASTAELQSWIGWFDKEVRAHSGTVCGELAWQPAPRSGTVCDRSLGGFNRGSMYIWNLLIRRGGGGRMWGFALILHINFVLHEKKQNFRLILMVSDWK